MHECHAQIRELDQKLQESTRLTAKLQATETDLLSRMRQETRACEVCLFQALAIVTFVIQLSL